MKNKKHLVLSLCVTLLVSLFAVFAVSCGGKGDATYDENGSYYTYVNNEAVNELVLDSGNFTLKLGSDNFSGKYTLKDGKLTIKTSDADIDAVFANDTVAFMHDGANYILYKDVDCTVSFVIEGGKTVAPVTITKGKALTSLETDEKFGYAFDGWYLTNEYKTLYIVGSTPIVADMTLYARFVSGEYKATFVTGTSETFPDRLTSDYALAELPTPEKAGFIGWWVSDTQNAKELTYQYNVGDKLNANTKLFAVYESDAVAVSVKNGEISWTSKGVNKTYTLTVTPPNGTPTSKTIGALKDNYNFTDKGEYKVEVTVDGKTATAYYTNKILPRVSFYSVEDNEFTFVPVEGATDYYLTVVCANEAHNHENVHLNSGVYSYDFSGCTPPQGGLVFTVRATADGMEDSVSDDLTVDRDLKIENLAYDSTADSVVWDEVTGATSYRVELSVDGGDPIIVNTGLENSFSVKNYTGGMTVKVYALASGYYSVSAELSFTKNRLATPSGIAFDGTTLTWDAVDGASSYNVKIGNNDPVSVYSTSYEITGLTADVEVTVQAVASNTLYNSNYSDAYLIKFSGMGEVTYRQGYVSWAAVSNAARYVVKVNDGEEQTLAAGATSYAVTFTKSGDNVVSVSYYDANDALANWSGVTVRVYAITFNSNDTETVLYRANGDKVNAPVPENTDTQVFAGWYDSEGGPNNNGALYKEEYFSGETDIELYAYYTGAMYVARLIVDENVGTVSVKEKKLEYNKDYTLPVPEAKNGMYIFDGWYSDINGTGRRYTNADGESDLPWTDVYAVNLYPRWISVLKYNLRPDGRSYSVRRGDAISLVSRIVIPAEYDGKPVTMIEPGAFNGCTNLTSISFYDNMEIVDLGLGGMQTNSAFQGCDNLKEIKVLPTNGDSELIFQDIDGVLFRNNPNNNNGIELYFFPAAKSTVQTDENGDVVLDADKNPVVIPYEVPYGVRVIPTNAFRDYRKFYAIKLPATIERIDSEAFSRCIQLRSVEFLEAPATVNKDVFDFDADETYEKATSLSIGTLAFNGCYYMETVTLPSRFEQKVQFNTSDALYEGTWDIFRGCSKLNEIIVDEDNEVYSSVQGMLATKDGRTILYCPRAKYQGSDEKVVVNIPTGVQNIGEYAFASCGYLKNLNIPGYVVSIGDKAFYGCWGLETLTFSGTAEDAAQAQLVIGERAFDGIDVTEIRLPANLKEVKAGAFGVTKANGSVPVRTVYLDCLTTAVFANGAFEAITEVTLSKNVPVSFTVGSQTVNFNVGAIFSGNTLVKVEVEPDGNFESEDGVLFTKGKTAILYYPAAKTGNYEIKTSVTVIGDNVFEGKSITEITIHAGITEIGANAFKDCKKLTTVTFVKEGRTKDLVIKAGAFKGCELLDSVELPEKTTEIGDSAFEGCSKLENVVIPTTVTKMGGYDSTGELISMNVFKDCVSLATLEVKTGNTAFETVGDVLYRKVGGKAVELCFAPTAKAGVVDIPDSVYLIWDNAFKGNTGITEVKFTNGLKLDKNKTLEIGERAFSGATKLQTVTLADGVGVIGVYAFENCTALETIVIPQTVTLIKTRAFEKCTALETVTFNPYVKPAEPETPAAPDAQSDTTGSETTPETPAKEEVGPELVFEATNGYSIFNGCTSLTSLQLPKRYVNIVASAFRDLNELVSVEFLGNIATIGDYAFCNDKKLADVVIPATSTATTIGQRAFYSTALETFTVPNNVTSIGVSAFEQAAITSVKLSDKLETIGNSAFADTALTAISIPASVTLIDRKAFYKNPYAWYDYLKARWDTLKSVTFPEKGSMEVGQEAFMGNTGLKTVDIKGVTKLGQDSFRGCTALTSVSFADNKCATINQGAFYQTGLTSFTFPTLEGDKLLTLDRELFYGCTALETVTLSKSVSSIEVAGTNGNVYTIFDGCLSIKTIRVDDGNKNFSVNKDYTMILFNKDGSAIKLVFGSLPLEEGTFEIMDGITEISSKSFMGQAGMKKLIIPASVTSIAAYAFSDLAALEEVVFKGESKLATIGDNAFSGCAKLKSIKLPNSVRTLGEYAFQGCSSLTEVTLPSSLTEIKKNTFNNCSSLAKVSVTGTETTEKFTLPAGVTAIGDYAFNGTALPEVTLSAAVKTINRNAFSANTALTKVTVNGVYDTIGIEVFKGCSQLSNVTLNDGITKLGNAMFDSCSALETIKLPSALKFFGTGTFKSSGLTSISIPDTVVHMGISEDAEAPVGTNVDIFNGCRNLETVKLPSGLLTMGGGVFNGCSKITSLTLPASLHLVGQYAFYGTGISSIDVSRVATFGERALGGCKSLTSVTFKRDIESLPNALFYDCAALETVVLPSNITSIGSNFFQNCTSLKNVTLPEGLTAIGNYAFRYCSNLSSIKLPESLLTIGSYAFEQSGLTSITLPASVTQLGTGSYYGSQFRNCELLTEVVFEGSSVTQLNGGTFYGCKNLEKIELPSSITSFVGSTGVFEGCVKLTSVTFPEGFTSISDRTFYGCTNLSEVSLPSTLTTIGANAFYGTALETVTIPENVTTLGSSYSGATFQDVTTLESVQFLTTKLTRIADETFDGCTSLSSVQLQNGITYIGENAFRNTALTEITLPETLTELDRAVFEGTEIATLSLPARFTTFAAPYLSDYSSVHDSYSSASGHSFYGMNSLTKFEVDNSNITFGAGEDGALYRKETGAIAIYPNGKHTVDLSAITSVESWAFFGCKFETLTVPAAMTEITDYAFAGCSADSVVIESGVETIGKAAFRNGSKDGVLKSVTIPNTVTSIGDHAFKDHTTLTTVTLPSGLTYLGTQALNMTGISTIDIPAGVKELNGSTFWGCENLTTVTLHEGLTAIGSQEFYNTGLTAIEVPASVTDLGDSAFQGTPLASVTLHEGLKTIGGSVFYETNITEITIPSTVEKFTGSQVFTNAKLLETVTFLGNTEFRYFNSYGTEYYATSVFANCDKLTSVTLPANLEILPTSTFLACKSLETVALPDTILTIANNAFQRCTALKTIKLPKDLTVIPSAMFDGCTSLTTVTYGDKVTTIQAEAFQDCESLANFELKDSVTTLGNRVFKNCTSLNSIIIPASVETVGSEMFDGWTATQTINIVKDEFGASLWNAQWNSGSSAKIVWAYKAA